MTVEVRTASIAFAGDLDVYRRAEIEAALPPADSADRIVIDMREVQFIDSTVISILMRYRRAFIDAGGDAHEIVLIVAPQVRRIFEITGLFKSLTVLTPDNEPKEPLAEA
jgi:anti-anti-sigma factor